MVKKTIALGFLLAISSASVVSSAPPVSTHDEDLMGSAICVTPAPAERLAKQQNAWNEESGKNSNIGASFKNPSRFAQIKECAREIGFSIASAFKKIFSYFSF